MPNSVQNIKLISPNIKNDGKVVNYFQQDIIAIPNNVINISCVYKLDPIDFQEIMNLQFKMLYLVL